MRITVWLGWRYRVEYPRRFVPRSIAARRELDGGWQMSIVDNKKAFFDYFIEERIEAGLALEGWEVKAIRAGRAQLKEAYVIVRNGEIFLIGAHISPLPAASTHINPEPDRTRKLLLHAEEIRKLVGKVERAGYALVPI